MRFLAQKKSVQAHIDRSMVESAEELAYQLSNRTRVVLSGRFGPASGFKKLLSAKMEGKTITFSY